MSTEQEKMRATLAKYGVREPRPVPTGRQAAFGCLVGLAIIIVNLGLFALAIAMVIAVADWALRLLGVLH